MKRKKKTNFENVLLQSVWSVVDRAKRESVKISFLRVSKDFLNFFLEKNGYPPIMICGLFYEVDENLTGISCYVTKVQ